MCSELKNANVGWWQWDDCIESPPRGKFSTTKDREMDGWRIGATPSPNAELKMRQTQSEIKLLIPVRQVRADSKHTTLVERLMLEVAPSLLGPWENEWSNNGGKRRFGTQVYLRGENCKNAPRGLFLSKKNPGHEFH